MFLRVPRCHELSISPNSEAGRVPAAVGRSWATLVLWCLLPDMNLSLASLQDLLCLRSNW